VVRSEDRLTSKEVKKIRKWVREKERLDRKGNIVLKGIIMPEEINKEKEKSVD